MLNKTAISKFDQMISRKSDITGGLVVLQFLWSVKEGTRTFNFPQNESSYDDIGPLDQYNYPWGKKPKKRKK